MEAEGTGESKLKALNDAWMEAVRKAVGMVMVGKQEAINDELTEQIVTHSRGQINSYKVLSEKNADGVWSVTILANIDKDILQETVGTSKTSVMAFDGTSTAAKKSSKEQKQTSALAVVKEALAIMKPEEWIECKTSIHKYTGRDGKEEYYASFILYPNLKNYKIQADQAEKLISRIASKAEDIKLVNVDAARTALQLIKQPQFDSKLRPDGIATNTGEGSHGANFGGVRAPKHAICFFKNVGNMRCYEFESKEVFNFIHSYDLSSYSERANRPEYIVSLSAESGDDFEGLLGQRDVKFNYPAFRDYSYGRIIYIQPSLGGPVTMQVNVPLKLTDEQLVNIKEIKGECKITLNNK